jgi:uncharacterized protein
VLLHLLPESVWQQIANAEHYAPESLRTEGFVHCTGDDETMLAVANSFYRSVIEPMVVLSLEEVRLTSEVRWEPPAHPDGRPARPDEPRFPHVYGPLDLVAVVSTRLLVRAADGAYVGFTSPG